MLIKLEDAVKAVEKQINYSRSHSESDLRTVLARCRQALRSLPTDDGVTDEMVERARDKLKVFVGMSVLFPSDDAIRAALEAALGPLPAPPSD